MKIVADSVDCDRGTLEERCRLYDSATWRMYYRITSARNKRTMESGSAPRQNTTASGSNACSDESGCSGDSRPVTPCLDGIEEESSQNRRNIAGMPRHSYIAPYQGDIHIREISPEDSMIPDLDDEGIFALEMEA